LLFWLQADFRLDPARAQFVVPLWQRRSGLPS
jgi:hypothetical protein